MNQYPKELLDSNQIVLFDENEFLVESCNTLFDSNDLKGIKASEWAIFLESVIGSYTEASNSLQELKFSKISEPSSFLPGIYDFVFSKISFNDKTYLLWIIYDYTKVYDKFWTFQQMKNEMDISRQYFEENLKKSKSIKELITKT